MENAADGLKMAAAVLIFVLAISITILSFGQVRETSDAILNYRDRETSYVDTDYYDESYGTERNVSLETIIPTIFRAYLENYKIVFDGLEEPIYEIKLSDGTIIPKYSLDLETKDDITYKNVVFANDNEKSEFLCGILYKDYINNEADFERKFIIEVPSISLYDQLKNATEITEYIGVYYQKDDPNVPDVNKTKKRIITYQIK